MDDTGGTASGREERAGSSADKLGFYKSKAVRKGSGKGILARKGSGSRADDRRRSGSTQGAPSSTESDNAPPLPPTRSVSHSVSMTLSTVNNVAARAKVGMALDKQQPQPSAVAQTQRATVNDSGPSMSRPPVRDHAHADGDGLAQCLAACRDQGRVSGGTIGGVRVGAQHLSENLLFSSDVIKTNRRGHMQTRWIVVTTTAVYNFDSKKFRKFKRRILVPRLETLLLQVDADDADQATVGTHAESRDSRAHSATGSGVVSRLTRSLSGLSGREVGHADSTGTASTAKPPNDTLVGFDEHDGRDSSMVLQVRHEYDYRLTFPSRRRRDEAVTALRYAHGQWGTTKALQVVEMSLEAIDAVMVNKSQARRHRNRTVELTGNEKQSAADNGTGNTGHAVRIVSGSQVASGEASQNRSAATAGGATAASSAISHARTATLDGLHLPSLAEQQASIDMVSLQLQQLAGLVRTACSGDDVQSEQMKRLKALCGRADAEIQAATTKSADTDPQPSADVAATKAEEESKKDVQVATDIAHSRLVADALWDDGARVELLRVMSASPQWASGRALFENVVLLLSASNPTVRHWAIKTLWMICRLAHTNLSARSNMPSKVEDTSTTEPQLPEVKAELEKRGNFAQLVVQGLRHCASDEWGAPLCRASYSALLELAVGRVTQPSERESSDVTSPVETFGRALAPDCAEALSAILELTNDKRMGQAHMSPSQSHAHAHGRLAQRDLSSHDQSHANAVHAHALSELKEAEEKEVDAPHLLQRDVLKDLNVLLLRESNFKHVLALDAQPHGAVADSGWQRLLWPTLTRVPQKKRSSVADEVLRYVLNAFASVHKYLFSTASPDHFMHTLDASFAALLAVSGWWYDTVQIARTLLISIVSKVSKSVRSWRFRPHAKEWSNLWKLLNAVEDFIFYRFVQQLEADEEAIEDRERAHPAVLRWRRHALTWTPIAKGGQNIGIHLDPNNASCSDLDLTLRIMDLLQQLGFRPVLPADDPMNNIGNKGAEAAAGAMAGGDEADKVQRDNARKGAEYAQAFRDYLTLFRGIEDSADAGDLASDTEIIEKVADFLQRRKRRGAKMGFFTRSKQRTMIKTLKLSMMRQQAQVRIRTATRTQHLASMQVSSVTHEVPTSASAGANDHDFVDSMQSGQPGAPVMPPLPDSPSAQHNPELARSPSQRHLLELSAARRKELGRSVLKRASLLLAAEQDGGNLEAAMLEPLTGVDENMEEFDDLSENGGDGKCAGCGDVVAASESIRALGRTWHVQCFCCAGCNKPFVQLAEELEQLSKQLQATAAAKGRITQGAQTRSPLTIGYFATSDALAKLADTIASVAAGPAASVASPGRSIAHTGSRSGSTVIPPENRSGATSSSGALTLEYYEHEGQPYCRTELVSRFGHNICAGCLEPLQRGEKVLSVLGMRWHPEHFCCSRCFEPIGADAPCFTREGRPYCKDCHEDEFERCPACGDLLGDAEIIDALGKSWHRDHFCCDYCDKPLADASFCSAVPSESHLRKCRAYREANGLGQCLPSSYASERPYCEEHYILLFVPKCCACGEALIDGGIDACGAVWHAECFRCTEPGCQRDFPDGHFYEADIEIEYERLREEQGSVYDNDDDVEMAARQRKALSDKLGRDAANALTCQPCEKDTHVENVNVEPKGGVASTKMIKTTLTRPWCEEHYFERFGKRCGGCKQPIRGDVFVALDQTWHAEHFVCCICNEPFSSHDLQFFPKDGKPYCEEHYVERFCERCAGCGEPIRDICASALGASWHPECLKCSCCGLLLDGKDNPVFRDAPPGSEREGEEEKSGAIAAAAGAGNANAVATSPSVTPRPMCGPCWNKKYCDTCMFCGDIIRGGVDACLEALGGKWHATCFKCPVCDITLGSTPFFPHAPPKGANEHEGANDGGGEEPQQLPYCRDHYLELFCERCGGCNNPIAPEEVATCVKALGKLWHRNCLKCSATGKVFGPGDPLLQKDGKLYCKEAYDKLFSESCAVCEKPLSGTVLKALGQKFHKECFVCFECGAKPTHGREKLPTCATHARTPEAELSEAGRAKLAAAKAKAQAKEPDS